MKSVVLDSIQYLIIIHTFTFFYYMFEYIPSIIIYSKFSFLSPFLNTVHVDVLNLFIIWEEDALNFIDKFIFIYLEKLMFTYFADLYS